MTLYRYSAIDGEGRLVNGELEAPGHEIAVDQLNASGYLPVEVAALDAAGPRDRAAEPRRPQAPRSARNRIRPADLTLFTRKLASILQAGLDLDRGIEMADRQSTRMN